MSKRILSAVLIAGVAMMAHSVNAAYCTALGDDSQKPWDDTTDDIRASAIAGVEFHLDNPDADASASHENWYKFKESDGWKFGEVKDAEKKTHPCMVAFDQLPIEQQAKDHLFKSVVAAMVRLATSDPILFSEISSDKSFSQAEVDGQIKKAVEQALLDTGDMSAAKSKAPKPKAIKPAKLKKDQGRTAPAEAALTGKTSIVCVDGDDVPIPGMGALQFSDSDYSANGDSALLLPEIRFPSSGPAADLAGLWLHDEDGNPISKARLFSPLQIGGGRSALMAKRTVMFNKLDS